MERGEEMEDIQASEKDSGSRRSVEVEDRGSVKMHGKEVVRELEEGEQGCVSAKKQEGNLKAQSGTLKVPVWRRKGQAKGRLNRTDIPMEIVPVLGIGKRHRQIFEPAMEVGVWLNCVCSPPAVWYSMKEMTCFSCPATRQSFKMASANPSIHFRNWYYLQGASNASRNESNIFQP
ncbi:NADH-quinone oxidoreductase subunit I [Striga asiatica]|uniref:NADH-quinone oxidoreductase subunit I n=1 Tax=Striga asiatica TaxID=4170 RepID=A0A5A7R024_STRAF|nr:NADH-quinone oxidoreductase subunit I [Striga asiatica]